MTEPMPPADDPTPETPANDAPAARRGSHRAPAKPGRMIGFGLIAIAAIVALLVAFSSCSADGGNAADNDNAAPITPSVSAPPTTAPPTTAPPTTAPPTTAPPTTAPPTTAPPTTPTARPSTPPATPKPTATPSTNAARMPVIVLNGTRTTGLGARVAGQVRAAGWTVSEVGNWRRTTVGDTTIFYASGDQAAAERLAKELPGDQAVRAALSGMSTTRLTLVVG